MKEINEKDLEKASGGLAMTGKCDSYEPAGPGAANSPEFMQTCSNCAHFSKKLVGASTCDLKGR